MRKIVEKGDGFERIRYETEPNDEPWDLSKKVKDLEEKMQKIIKKIGGV